MKLKYIFILTLMLTTVSCGKFLENKNMDQVIPNSLDHYNELMFGSVISLDVVAFGRNLELMTDDVSDVIPENSSADNDSRKEHMIPWYTWAKNNQVDKNGNESIDKSYQQFYSMIVICNIIEDKVDQFEDDIAGLKFKLLGEAQCMRAIAYYYLTGMYADIYKDTESSKTAMGVPINKETGIRDYLYKRSSLYEVHELMKKDLNSAIVNLEKGAKTNSVYRPNSNVARLFLSRLYLNEKNWNEVIKVCDEIQSNSKNSITSLESLKKYDKHGEVLYSKKNASIMFAFTKREIWGEYVPGGTWQPKFVASPDLINSYSSKDARVNGFFSTDGYEPIKHSSSTSKIPNLAFRIEEVYFNKAEALIESGKFNDGLEQINLVRYNRIDDVDYALAASSQSEARILFRAEKRREFCFEDIRWFDIRKWGVSVEHKFHDMASPDDFKTYVLTADSPNYILPLPLDLIRINDVIEKRERVDTEVLN